MGYESRRKFLQFATLAAIGVAAAACERRPPPMSLTFTPEAMGFFTAGEQEAIISAAKRYNAKLTPPTPSMTFHLNTQPQKITPQGEAVAESATPGSIIFDRTTIVNARITNSQWRTLDEVTLHAMTHATKPLSPSPCPTFNLDIDHDVTAYHGLNLITDVPRDKITILEEAAAEFLATVTKPDYSFGTGYYSLRELITGLMSSNMGIQVARFCQSNDVPGFVKLISQSSPTPTQIKYIVRIFQHIASPTTDASEYLKYIQNRNLLKATD